MYTWLWNEQGRKTLSIYDNEDDKKEETVNELYGSFNIYECGKKIPIDVQTIMYSIELYQGCIHESWNKISQLVPTS